MIVEKTNQVKAKEFALAAHSGTNHFYDKYLPYEFHLRMVVQAAVKFIHLIPAQVQDDVLSACWLHDVMEDCRVNYSEVKNLTNTYVAEIVRACTNDGRGRNRKERMPDSCYEDMRDTPFAIFVKLCDRIANVQYSSMTGSSMFDKYKQEHGHFQVQLKDMAFDPNLYQPMWDYLQEIFNKTDIQAK